MQACTATWRVARIDVPSAKGGASYPITVIGGTVTCGCPGGRFRGRCHHVQVGVEACGWATGADEQTSWQEADHVCPRCGGRTVDGGGLTHAPLVGDPTNGGEGGRS
jgi:hypothetical protein